MPLPVGFFVPFEVAWKAVKEFLETDGRLPEGIEWAAHNELPPNAFPDRRDPVVKAGLIDNKR
jgi:hypothetical protein